MMRMTMTMMMVMMKIKMMMMMMKIDEAKMALTGFHRSCLTNYGVKPS